MAHNVHFPIRDRQFIGSQYCMICDDLHLKCCIVIIKRKNEKYQRVQSLQVHRIPAHRSNIMDYYTIISYCNAIIASKLGLSLY